jgi:2-amino-4-hydroxy-6-hydroxymethyldihydropteridine diphosphokinase
MLDADLRPIRLSRVYETAPVGVTEQPHFLNMVAELDGKSLPPPEPLLARLLRIEYVLGRTRDVPQGPRTIDLDLLLYKNETSDTEYLKLPHPRLHLRRFVLVPLNELCPNLVHPTLNRTISQLLDQTGDDSDVRLWTPVFETL